MEIQALRMSVMEADLNELIRRYLPPEQPIEDLRVCLGPDGIRVSGQYPFFITVNFETAWEVGVVNGLAAARLANFKAMGVPGNIFKSAIMKVIEDAAKKESWIRIDGDQILADLEAACIKYAIPAKLRLQSVTVTNGELVIAAGAPVCQ
jgi:hypothetical protein